MTGKDENRGFEMLSRQTLQNNSLSLSARGLLANMASYHENWVLRKTEIRERFATESPKAVDRYWDELVAHNYILQFRKREGKKYDYQYFYRVNKFTVQEVAELINQMTEKGYFLYHKEMAKAENKSSINYLDYIFVSDTDKKKIELAISTCSFGLPKTTSSKKIVKSTFDGLPISTCPNRQSNRDLSKRDLSKDIDDDDLYIQSQKNLSNDNQGGSMPKIKTQSPQSRPTTRLPRTKNSTNAVTRPLGTRQGASLPKTRDEVETYFEALNSDVLYKTDVLLQERSVSQKDRKKIIVALDKLPHLHNLELIQEQVNWCETKAQETSISSYPSYFLGGLKQRYVSIKDSSKYEHFVIPV